jgi:hypothetical protein
MGLGTLGKFKNIGDTSTIADGDSVVSYLSDAAGNIFTSTLVGSDQALDVNVVQSGGQYAEDSAHTTADLGNFSLSVRSDAAASTAGTTGDYAGFITDALGKMWTTGSYAEDSAHTSGDTMLGVMGVRSDAGGSLASADGDYTPLSIDANGNLRVLGTFTSNTEKNEDAAHSSGDIGNYVLAVRQDTAGTGVSADGDYASMQQTKTGYMRTSSASETAILQALHTVPITTAAAIPATALAGRKHILIQNISNNTIWVGSSTTTVAGATQGVNVAKGGTYEADLTDDVILYALANGSTEDVIVLESA